MLVAARWPGEEGAMVQRWARVGMAIAVVAACGVSAAQPVVKGGVLTTPKGLTLYVFDNDVPGAGKSVCNAPCTNIFLPYRVEPGKAAKNEASVITRDDGAQQWAWKGRPLYIFYDDKKPGDKLGDGLRQVWHVARP
jgi:predicted lipoprotein with Yx(FWY)xxD motif